MDDGVAGSGLSLFRPEAVQAARERMGSPVRPVGLTAWALTIFMVIVLVGVVGFLSVARYARKETVTGILQPAAGALRIAATRPAVVAAVHVHEGESVSQGQPIATLAMDPAIAGGQRLGAVLAQASLQQSEALTRQAQARKKYVLRQREEIQAKRSSLLQQQQRLASDVDLQMQRVRLSLQTVEAARVLVERQLMSALQYRQREEAYIAARQSLSAIEREQSSIPSALAQLSAQEQGLLAEAEETAAMISSAEGQLLERRAATQAEARLRVVWAPGGSFWRAEFGEVTDGPDDQPVRLWMVFLEDEAPRHR